MAGSDAPARRGPGRPRQSDEEQAAVKEGILLATEAVYARHGSRELTVTKIIERASIARSTFYRHFRNADEPLRIVVDRIGRNAVSGMAQALRAAPPDVTGRLRAAVDAYLDWSTRYRHLLPSVFTDLHDPGSSVAGLRRKRLDQTIELLLDEFDVAGRPRPPRATVDIFINSVEYAAFRMHVDSDAGPDAVTQARATMVRLAIALLGNTESWLEGLATPGFITP
jgi:AcrR family transcriptional regulator